MMARACILGFVLLCTAAVFFPQLDQVTKGLGLGSQSGLSDSKVASGERQLFPVIISVCAAQSESILGLSSHCSGGHVAW